MKQYLTFLLSAFVVALPSMGTELVVDGKLRLCIVQPAAPDKLERQAARELVEHLEAITGERAAVVAAPLPEMIAVRLGVLTEAHREELESRSRAPGSYALVVRGDDITIGGVTPIGTLYGVYDLLEQLGVRWYMPGELGRVLPTGDRLAVVDQARLQSPSFAVRGMSGAQPIWRQRSRLGGIAQPSSLSFPDPAPFAEHPEFFALVKGERRPNQLCVSNPEVLRLEAEVMRAYFEKRPTAIWMPVSNHGDNHCECDGCRALDPPERLASPFTGGINLNDRYVWFCNRLLESVAGDLPGKRLMLTVCTPQFQPPSRTIGHANLDVLAWANGFCRLHGVNNPACPQRQGVLALETQWVKVLQGEFHERSDWGNIAGPGLPLPAVHRYRRDFPAYHAAGIKGVRGSDYSHYISQLPSSYVGARLLWDHETDVEALLSDFYSRFYGPAAAPMQAYHELLERTMRDAPFHAGSAIDFPRVYTKAVRSQARESVNQALAGATDAPYRDRTQAISLNLDYLDAFCTMIDARDQARFADAHAALDACRQLIANLQAYDPPLLNPSFARPYLDLFFGNAIEAGWRRTTSEERMIAALDPVWDFQLDPMQEAEEAWQPQPTWTSSWVSEGLGEYDGVAWYRQRFELPKGDAPLRLWFGGVDEGVTVWLNGKPIGTHTGAFRHFDFDITEAAAPGEVNVLLLRVVNQTLDEVGTGGLIAPVFVYSPRE